MTKKPKTTSVPTGEYHDGQEELYALIRSLKDDLSSQLAEQIKINQQLAEQTESINRQIAGKTRAINGIREQVEDMKKLFSIGLEPIVWHSPPEHKLIPVTGKKRKV